MRSVCCLISGLLILAPRPSVAMAEEATWNLVFEDDFERAEIGDGWHLCGEKAVAKIVDGRLFLDGRGATILINRSFKPDVKIEFVAEANPEALPCDLSCALPGSNEQGYWHLLGFGAGGNKFNHIVSGGAHVRDLQPKKLIEHGRKYKLVGVKEGKHLAYYVNDEVIVETDVEDPLGGPAFDQVGLVTWNGMYVDYVKVYERESPAPGGPVILQSMPDLGFTWNDRRLSYSGQAELAPNVAKAVDLYNARSYRDAIDTLLLVEPPSIPSIAVLAYVLGDVAYESRADDLPKLRQLAEKVSMTYPDHRGFQEFDLATKWFTRITVRSRDRIACVRLTTMGPENNPYYYKAKLFLTRFHYASALEGARQEARAAALEQFAELRKIWPEHQALREFGGEKIPWGKELIRDESDGPAWARYVQEAMARQQAILNWWGTVRQAKDGSLGGGWGDDVELLRTWVPATCVSNACADLVIERLAQGVWDNVLLDGYDKGCSDVEHSAEPSADSLPTMILLRYGDPQWVEYNLRSAKTIYEKFMAVNDRGFLQFKSTEFGIAAIRPRFGNVGGDTGYHARAMKHFIWLAWYGIPEAKDVFLRWCDTWHDITMRQIDTKPPGFPPPTIWYPSGDIFPPNGKPWYDERSNYYRFPGLGTMVLDSFLTAYALSGREKYLEPVNAMMDLATRGPLAKSVPNEPAGHPQNLLATAAHFSTHDITGVYRWLTGERVYDEYTLRGPSPTQRYQIDYDLEQYARAFEGLARRLRNNWTQFTSEVLQTDRAGLYGASEIMGGYTGAVRNVRDAGAPTLGVTWLTENLDFAAMVSENEPRRLRVRLYNFNDHAIQAGLRPWRLVPGEYVLNAGEQVSGEKDVQKRYAWDVSETLEHTHRGTPIPIWIPPHKEWVVDLRCRRAIDRPEYLPDLAIAAREVVETGTGLRVTVHNIGGDKAAPFDVVVQVQKGGKLETVARARVDGLPVIRGFEPVKQDLELRVDTTVLKAGYLVVVDPELEVLESYEMNNAVGIHLPQPSTPAGTLSAFMYSPAAARKPQAVRTGLQGPFTMCRQVVQELTTRYLIHLPADYDESGERSWPLVVFLHGAGERGDQIHQLAKWGPFAYAAEHADFPFIAVGPQCPLMKDWSPEIVSALIDEVIERYHVDTDRVYLTGLSMGGAGTWETAMAYPDRFAAIAPLCGRVVPLLSGALWQMPVWVFHGEQDDVVPFSQSKEIVTVLRGMGNEKVEFTTYPEGGHQIWQRVYGNAELYDWFLKHRRSDRP